MVEFVLTPPFLIPVAIAAVLGAAMMKTPERFCQISGQLAESATSG